MAEPKGKLVTPVAFDPLGVPHALDTVSGGILKIYVAGGSLNMTPHDLLNGIEHPDTVDGSAVEGDIIVGVDQGAGQIKWQRLARGSTGQVPTVQADGSIAYASPGGGFLVQSVYNAYNGMTTGTTTLPYDDTIPQNTEGDEYMSLAITPSNAGNDLEITVHFLGATATTGPLSVALFRDSEADALFVTSNRIGAASYLQELNFSCRVPAGSVNVTTFKVRAGANGAGTTTFNGAAGSSLFSTTNKSSIIIKEFSG